MIKCSQRKAKVASATKVLLSGQSRMLRRSKSMSWYKEWTLEDSPTTGNITKEVEHTTGPEWLRTYFQKIQSISTLNR